MITLLLGILGGLIGGALVAYIFDRKSTPVPQQVYSGPTLADIARLVSSHKPVCRAIELIAYDPPVVPENNLPSAPSTEAEFWVGWVDNGGTDHITYEGNNSNEALAAWYVLEHSPETEGAVGMRREFWMGNSDKPRGLLL